MSVMSMEVDASPAKANGKKSKKSAAKKAAKRTKEESPEEKQEEEMEVEMEDEAVPAKKAKKEKKADKEENVKKPLATKAAKLKAKVEEKKKKKKVLKKSKKGSDESESDEKEEKEEKEKKPKTEEEKKADRTKQKNLREERQKKNKTESVYDLGRQAKKVWETVRREDCPEADKEKLLKELHVAIKGNVKKLIYAHDTVRVVECLVAKGGDELKEAIFQEMKGDVIEMAKSQYAYFFVVKLIKYGSKSQRKIIFDAFKGRVAELMKHKVANNAVEMYYNEVAGADERNAMLQEFCGPEFRHFKEPDLRTVNELLERHPEKKKDIVRHLGDNVCVLLTKGCYNHSLVHTVIYNFLQVCDKKRRAEVVEQMRDVCLHILHSHDGSRASMHSLWYGTPKDRKAILKAFKGHVVKIALEKQGYLVLLALFDSVDDTKIVGKAIVGEIAENMKALVESESGRKVLMYLMARRDTKYFHPQIIDILKQGDGNENTKKPADTRSNELRDVITGPLCKYILENLSEMMYSNPATILITCAVNNAKPEHSEPVLAALAEEACKPFSRGDKNIIETTCGHQMLKKLVAMDKTRSEAGTALFSTLLIDAMDEDSLESLVQCNRGQFLLVALLETELDVVVKPTKEKLNTLKKTVSRQKTKGAEVLKKKMGW